MIQYLIAAIINFTFSVLAIRRKDESASWVTAFCTFCFGSWALELYFLSAIKNLELLYPLFYVTRWGMFFITFAFALFAYQILQRRSKKYIYYVLIPGFTSTFSLCLANVFVFPSTLYLTDGGYLPEFDITFTWFTISSSLMVIATIVYCILSYRSVPFREKQKVRWLLATLLVQFTAGWISTLFFTKENYLKGMVSAVFITSFAIMFYYTSSSRQLMNLKLALIEGISKVFIVSSFVMVFFIIIHFSGEITPSLGNILIAFLFIVFTTQYYPILLDILQPRVRKIVSKRGYDHKKARSTLQKSLNECANLDQLSKILNQFSRATIEVSFCKVILNRETDKARLSINPNSDANQVICNSNHFSSTLSYIEENSKLALIDEVPQRVKSELSALNIGAVSPIILNGNLMGILAIGSPTFTEHFKNEDLFLAQWLSEELGLILDRIMQFKDAQDELANARKTISLIGVMNQYHHDIKTPLAIIDGVVSTDFYDRDKQRHIVLEQVERGTKLIAMMANILRGKRNRTISAVQINDIIKDSLFIFEKRFHRIDMDLSSIPQFYGDSVDLKIMFVNVIKNASESGISDRTLNLVVKTWTKDSTTYVSIQDTGSGIQKEQLLAIWDFGPSVKHGGSGVGLQAIKRIADEHDIAINVQSDINSGTTFTFTFPISANQNNIAELTSTPSV